MSKLKMKDIGKMNFSGTVQVTDPCYNSDVWCRTTIDVKPGEYACRTWMSPEERVGIIGIYLNGAVPPQKSMEEIGTIGVDAGFAGFFMKKPDYSDSEWNQFCNIVCENVSGRMKDFWIFDDVINTVGFFSSSGYGDGEYPVYVCKDTDGEIIAAEIRFM